MSECNTHKLKATKRANMCRYVCKYVCYCRLNANRFCEFGTLNCNEIKLNSLETLKEFLITLINLLCGEESQRMGAPQRFQFMNKRAYTYTYTRSHECVTLNILTVLRMDNYSWSGKGRVQRRKLSAGKKKKKK